MGPAVNYFFSWEIQDIVWSSSTKRCWFPKRCFFSNKQVWFKKCYVGQLPFHFNEHRETKSITIYADTRAFIIYYLSQ
jgi:hypothetical protein